MAAQAHVGTIRKPALPQARIIRPAVRLNVRHPAQHFGVAPVDQAAYTAHR